MLFVVETTRFKSPSVVKMNKLGAVRHSSFFLSALSSFLCQLAASFKPIRAEAIAILKHIAGELSKLGEADAAGRPAINAACASLFSSNVSIISSRSPEIDPFPLLD